MQFGEEFVERGFKCGARVNIARGAEALGDAGERDVLGMQCAVFQTESGHFWASVAVLVSPALAGSAVGVSGFWTGFGGGGLPNSGAGGGPGGS